MFERTKSGSQQELIVMLRAMKNVAEKHAENLAEFYSQLCDEKVFEEETMEIRSSIFASIGGVNKVTFWTSRILHSLPAAPYRIYF